MKMKTTSLVLPLLSLVLASPAVLASSDEYEEYYERRGPMPFSVMDLNGDGVITAEEHAKVRGARMSYRAKKGYPMRNAGNAPSFEQIDTDGNGSVSPEEMNRWQQTRRQGMGRGWNR
jgi:Ca2+-binding EF-hand superfamily protein